MPAQASNRHSARRRRSSSFQNSRQSSLASTRALDHAAGGRSRRFVARPSRRQRPAVAAAPRAVGPSVSEPVALPPRTRAGSARPRAAAQSGTLPWRRLAVGATWAEVFPLTGGFLFGRRESDGLGGVLFWLRGCAATVGGGSSGSTTSRRRVRGFNRADASLVPALRPAWPRPCRRRGRGRACRRLCRPPPGRFAEGACRPARAR